MDGLPLAIELAAARVNVLGLAELVSILERRAALLRDSPGTPTRAAPRCKSSWTGATTSCTATRRRCSSSSPSTAAAPRSPSLVAVAATHGLNEATVDYLLSALVDKSIVSVSFSGGAARYDMLDTVREYVLERLAESGGLAAVRGAHAEYFAGLAEEARVGLRGPEWLALASAASSWRTTISGPRSPTRAKRPTPPSRLGSGRSGWYFALAERVSEGRRFLELALDATATTSRSSCGSSCSPASATSRPRSSISTPRSRRASARSRSPRPRGAERSSGSRS